MTRSEATFTPPTSSASIAAGLLMAAVWLGFCTTALAQDPPPKETSKKTTIAQVRVGFEGHYKVGYWTPVEVTLRGGTESFTGEIQLFVPDGDGVQTRVTTLKTSPVQTVPGVATSPVMMVAKFGRTDGNLLVRFVADGKIRAEREYRPGLEQDERHIPYAKPSTDELILTLGPSVGVASAIATRNPDDGPSTYVVQLPDVSALPTRWYGYEGVDMLVLSTSQPEIYRKLLTGGARVEALKRWVKMGGQLVMFVGVEAPEILDETSPLADLAPGLFERMAPLRQTRALEAYCNTTDRINTGSGTFRIDTPVLTDITGNIEAYEGNRPRDLPLIVRAAHGFGEVVMVAIDMDRPPFSLWKGRSEFLRRVLRHTSSKSEDKEESQVGRFTMLGYTDLVGQLRHALEQFEGVTPAPFWLVAGLVCFYILLIGPGDYFLVKKFLRRMELTWVTFPVIVVGVSVGAYYMAYWMKGDSLRVNQVELVDVDTESGLTRGTTWTQIFSPRPDAYNLSFEPKLPSGQSPQARGDQTPRVLISWLGLPGTALGGMRPTAANPPLFSRPYAFTGQLDGMQNVPIQVWSTKSITTRWIADDQAYEKTGAGNRLSGTLHEEIDRMLSGEIVNDLGIDLVGCRLFYDRWIYTFSSLKDGGRQAIDRSLRPKTIKTWLTSRGTNQTPQYPSRQFPQSSPTAKRVLDRTSASTVRAYDQSSQSVPYILDFMMFGKAAGGVKYTRLLNRYQSYCDLSDHLRLGRAILVARASIDPKKRDPKTDGSQLLRDGEPMAGPDDRRWVFYRFVFPVQRDP